MAKNTEQNCRLGVVGGQAVLEGVMMRHKDRCSIAVRKENGSITVKNDSFVSLRKKHKFCNIPILRGAINMVEMLMLSFRTLGDSAEMFGLEEIEESKTEKWMKQHLGAGILDIVMFFGILLGIALSVFLFIFLPSVVTKFIEGFTQNGLGWWKNLIEGLMKMLIFVGYLSVCLLMKDIRRTFEYHGAEHKSIFCYEAGEELTPENVKKYKRFHPRCGTSFMFVIILISILISSLPIIPWENTFLRMLVKLAFLPLIVGISFEFIMVAGKHSDNIIVKIISAPGLLMQRITTREPDLDQIEVAIHALKSSMPEEFPDYVAPEIYVKKDGAQEMSEEAPVSQENTEAEGSDSDGQSEDAVVSADDIKKEEQ